METDIGVCIYKNKCIFIDTRKDNTHAIGQKRKKKKKRKYQKVCVDCRECNINI